MRVRLDERTIAAGRRGTVSLDHANWAVKYMTCDQTGETHVFNEGLAGNISCRWCCRAFSAKSLADFATELMRVVKASQRHSEGEP